MFYMFKKIVVYSLESCKGKKTPLDINFFGIIIHNFFRAAKSPTF